MRTTTRLAWTFALIASAAAAQTQLLGAIPGCGGFGVAGTDDWDGDGKQDVVRGCAGGQIAVVSSTTGATLSTLQLSVGLTILGIPGTIVDFDADGHREVVVHTPGFVAVYSFASPSSPLWQRTAPLINGVQWYRPFAVVGDIDADGVEDVAAGYPGGGPDCANLYSMPPIVPFAGLLEILSGATGSVLRSHVSPIGDGWPFAVAPLGDLDGDGTPDYVASGIGRPPPSVTSCLPFGIPLPGMVSRLVAINGPSVLTPMWQRNGPPASFAFVDPIGDFDGDLDADLLVRANLLPGTTAYEAVVEASSGAYLWQSQAAGVTLLYGGAAFAGDMNGDGLDEFLTRGANGVLVRSGGSAAPLYELNGVLDPPIPIGDLDVDGRTDFAFQTGSGQYGPGFASWLIVSVGPASSAASAAWFGTGCGAGGPVPGLVMSGPPYFGWQRTLAYVNGPPGASALVFLGVPGLPTTLSGGCNALLDLAQPLTMLWNPLLDGAGSASAIFVVPAIPGFVGGALRLQGAHVAAGGSLAVTAAIDLAFGF
jgi:hypothetical protein